MRFVAAVFRALRPFSRIWVFLFAVALFLTFGLGGGTPNSATWLVIKFSLLGLLAAGLLGVLASKVWGWLSRGGHARSSALLIVDREPATTRRMLQDIGAPHGLVRWSRRREDNMASNLERLQAEGIATKTPADEPYASVIDELSEEEVAALISVKRRFEDRSEVQAHSGEAGETAQEFFAVI
jgi:hypothetical protein